MLGKLNDLQMDFGSQQQAQPIQILQEGNRFLYENEAVQNFNNSANVVQFWAENGLSLGRKFNIPQSGSGGEGKSSNVDLRFRFGLSIEDKVETLEKSLKQEEAGKEVDKKMAPKPAAKPDRDELESKSKGDMKDGESSFGMGSGGRGRSSLLQRRGQTQAEQEVPSDPAVLIQNNILGAPITSNDPFAAAQVQAMPQAAAQAPAPPQEPDRVATSTGMLSLKFDIPSDGTHIDFIRVGGNPSLALDVRSSKAFHKGLGLIWLAVCTLGGLFLIGPGRRGESSSFFLRLFLLAGVAGLIAFLLMPINPARIGFTACIVSAIAVAIILAARNLRRPSAT